MPVHTYTCIVGVGEGGGGRRSCRGSRCQEEEGRERRKEDRRERESRDRKRPREIKLEMRNHKKEER